LIDCTYDWTAANPTAQSAAQGRISSRRCSVAVVSRDGETQVFPITGIRPAGLASARLNWSRGRVILRAGGVRKSYAPRLNKPQ
jgi:hypothetical protein